MPQRLILTAICLALLASCSRSSVNQNGDTGSGPATKALSAKEAFQLADANAKQWKADAKLYSISQRGVLQELLASPNGETTWDFADVKTGRSRRWVFEYFSDASLAVLFVDVLDGKVDSNEISKFDQKPPSIPENFVDSVDASRTASAAIEKALKIDQARYMALSSLKTIEARKATWLYEFYESQGNKALYGVAVDALSGKIVSEEKPD